MKTNYIAGIIAIVIIAAFVVFALSRQNVVPGQYDEFAKCLLEKGTVMYGTEWCSHCKNQKALFGTSFQYVNYVDCDASKQACLAAGVTGYPTWAIDGTSYPGEKKLEDLAVLSKCELNQP